MFSTHNLKALRVTLNAFPVAMFAAQRAAPHFPFHILCINLMHEEQSGIHNDDIAGLRPLDILPPHEGEAVESRYSLCVRRNRVISYRELLHLDGVPTFWRTTLQPVKMQGTVQRIIGTAVPIQPSSGRGRPTGKNATAALATLAPPTLRACNDAIVPLHVAEHRSASHRTAKTIPKIPDCR